MKKLVISIDQILTAILVICIFSFKVTVLGIGGSGIRLDDIILVFAFALLLIRGDFWRTHRSAALNWYLWFILFSFVSVCWNVFNGRVEFMLASLFVARLVEYIVFYYIGYSAAQSGTDLTRIMKYYLWTLCIVVPLQMLNIVPSPNEFSNDRPSGNNNGPYELAAVAAFLLCFLFYRNKNRLSGLASVFLILVTAARSTFAGAAVSLFKVMLQKSRKVALIAVASLGAIVVALLAFLNLGGDSVLTNVPVLQRFSKADTAASGFDLRTIYSATPTYKTSADYSSGAFAYAIAYASRMEGDASTAIRVFRWTALVKSCVSNVDTILIGLGPSFGTTAVDGYFVRVFAETGLVGLALFALFIWSLINAKSNSPWPFREFVLILLFTAVSIDIFASYKTMLLLWLWHGLNEQRAGNSTSSDRW